MIGLTFGIFVFTNGILLHLKYSSEYLFLHALCFFSCRTGLFIAFLCEVLSLHICSRSCRTSLLHGLLVTLYYTIKFHAKQSLLMQIYSVVLGLL